MTDEEFQRVMEAGRKALEAGKKALEQSTQVLEVSKKTQKLLRSPRNQQADTPRDLIPQRLRDEWARDEERWNKRAEDLHQRRLALLDMRIERERATTQPPPAVQSTASGNSEDELGARFAQYNEELKRLSKAAKAIPRFDENTARSQFPQFTCGRPSITSTSNPTSVRNFSAPGIFKARKAGLPSLAD